MPAHRPTDFVIVGAGIYGVGLAWELGRRGARVLVLEAERVASGASGGLGRRGVRSNGRHVAELPLMAMAQRRWRRLARTLGDPRVFERIGHLHLIESEDDLPAAGKQVRLQVAHGVRTELVDGDALHRLEPFLGRQVIASLYAPDDGASDHGVTTRSLARAATQHAVRIARGTHVTGVEQRSGRADVVVTADGRRIPVGHELVLTTNAGTADLLLASFGIRLPFVNVLPHVLVSEPVRRVPVRHVIGHVRRRLSMKPLPGRRIMITGGRLGRVDEQTGRGVAIDAEVAGNLAEAVELYSGLAGVRLARAAADRFEAISADFLPVVDRVPGVVNVLVATGWCGHGWAPAPAYVALMASWLLDGRRPELLAPFGFARFG